MILQLSMCLSATNKCKTNLKNIFGLLFTEQPTILPPTQLSFSWTGSKKKKKILGAKKKKILTTNPV